MGTDLVFTFLSEFCFCFPVTGPKFVKYYSSMICVFHLCLVDCFQKIPNIATIQEYCWKYFPHRIHILKCRTRSTRLPRGKMVKFTCCQCTCCCGDEGFFILFLYPPLPPLPLPPLYPFSLSSSSSSLLSFSSYSSCCFSFFLLFFLFFFSIFFFSFMLVLLHCEETSTIQVIRLAVILTHELKTSWGY